MCQLSKPGLIKWNVFIKSNETGQVNFNVNEMRRKGLEPGLLLRVGRPRRNAVGWVLLRQADTVR